MFVQDVEGGLGLIDGDELLCSLGTKGVSKVNAETQADKTPVEGGWQMALP